MHWVLACAGAQCRSLAFCVSTWMWWQQVIMTLCQSGQRDWPLTHIPPSQPWDIFKVHASGRIFVIMKKDLNLGWEHIINLMEFEFCSRSSEVQLLPELSHMWVVSDSEAQAQAPGWFSATKWRQCHALACRFIQFHYCLRSAATKTAGTLHCALFRVSPKTGVKVTWSRAAICPIWLLLSEQLDCPFLHYIRPVHLHNGTSIHQWS